VGWTKLDAIQFINEGLYIPSVKLRIENAVIFLGVVLLVLVFHFFSSPLDAVIALIQQSGSSLHLTLFILLIGFSLSFVIIYSGVDQYFIGWRHAFRATLGTTALASIAYGIVWCLFEIGQARESIILFTPSQWSMAETLNNMMAGTLLAIFSSIGLSNRLYFKDAGAYDFSEFQKVARYWKLLVRKRLTKQFGQDDHDRLLQFTQSMIEGLDARKGWVQPAVELAANELKSDLEIFDGWYRDQTAGVYTEFNAFDAGMKKRVRKIMTLC
jgi:hypothetical protein